MILKFETMKNTQKTVVQGTASLITLGKSKRLAAMRESINRRVDKEEVAQKYYGAKNKEREIQQARIEIKQSIAEIKATYPQGRQNKLFTLRYGSEEKINQMGLQQLFTLLKIRQVLAKDIAETKFNDR
jgi:chorismate mutase